MSPEEMQQTISLIEETCTKYGIDDAYFVGGYPRTVIMGLPLTDVHDLDVASGKPGRARSLAGFVAEEGNADDINYHHRTSAVTVSLGNVEVDFQGSETHEEVMPYVRMAGVAENPIALNIFDRDFTMNSLAIHVGTNRILDITKRGITDIHNKNVVSIIPAEVKVKEDPLMITRAIRMCVKYNFSIDDALWKAMKRYSGLLNKKLTPQRLAIEAYILNKYPASKEFINKLGIEYLRSTELVELGTEEAES